MFKIKLFLIIIFLFPQTASALQIQDFLQPGVDLGFSAQSYLVANRDTGQILLSKNADEIKVPASLTKLVAILTFLDLNINPKKAVVITKSHRKAGLCLKGGSCLINAQGSSYTTESLIKASLIASSNDAVMALVSSTGKTMEEFVKLMNEKAKNLGALNTGFVEPTGISPLNKTTAKDMAKITTEAFKNLYLSEISKIKEFKIVSTDGKKRQKLKNTNQLLGDDRLNVIGAKTGYIAESRYNFSSWLADRFGTNFVVVVLGSKSQVAEFDEARKLLELGGLAWAFKGSVLGAKTEILEFNN